MTKKDEAENIPDIRSRYSPEALSFVEPLIEQAEDMAVVLSRLGKEMKAAPSGVNTGCGSTKRNPVIAEFCELNKSYRSTIAQLMDAQDEPKKSDPLFSAFTRNLVKDATEAMSY